MNTQAHLITRILLQQMTGISQKSQWVHAVLFFEVVDHGSVEVLYGGSGLLCTRTATVNVAIRHSLLQPKVRSC